MDFIDEGKRVVAVHSSLGLLAVCSAYRPGSEETEDLIPLVLACGSLQKLQRLPEASGASCLAWHLEGLTLATLTSRSGTVPQVLLWTADGPANACFKDSDPPLGNRLQLVCAHRVLLASMQLAARNHCQASAALCFGAHHLITAVGEELSFWSCTFQERFSQAPASPHLLHIDEKHKLRESVMGSGPISKVGVDPSGRFIATLHGKMKATSVDGNAENATTCSNLYIWHRSLGDAGRHDLCNPSRQGKKVPRSERARLRTSILARERESCPEQVAATICSTAGDFGAVALSHSASVDDFVWCPGVPSCSRPAMLAAITCHGTVVVWGENSWNEALSFVPETTWVAPSMRLGFPNGSCTVSSICWSHIFRCEETLGPELVENQACQTRCQSSVFPLQPHGHPDVDASAPSCLMMAQPHKDSAPRTDRRKTALVILRPDATVVVMRFDATTQRGTARPFEVRLRIPMSLPHRAKHNFFSRLCFASSRSEEIDIWLVSESGDLVRSRLESGSDDLHQDICSAGAVFHCAAACTTLKATTPQSEPCLKVDVVVVHQFFNFVACHAQVPRNQEAGCVCASLLWVGEIPCDLPDSEHARNHECVGSLLIEEGVGSLCWVPDQAVPPMLLCTTGRAGHLKTCCVDVVRGSAAAWPWCDVLYGHAGFSQDAVTRVVRVFSTGSDFGNDGWVGVLLQVQPKTETAEINDLLQLLLGRLERPGPNGSVFFHALYRHPMLLAGSVCFSVEMMCSPQFHCHAGSADFCGNHKDLTGLSHGNCLGQLAVWSDFASYDDAVQTLDTLGDSVGGNRRASVDDFIDVFDLLLLDQAASDKGVGNDDSALRIEAPPVKLIFSCPGRRVLDVAVSSNWVLALSSQAHVFVWRLPAQTHTGPDEQTPLTIEPCRYFALLSSNAFGKLYTTSPTLSAFPCEASFVTESADLRGHLSLRRFASGGIGVLVTSSIRSTAVQKVLICTRHASRGEVWNLAALRGSGGDNFSESVAWSGCGSVIGASSPRFSRTITIVASKLPGDLAKSLVASAPCPAYHPDTIIWLLRRGDFDLAKQILRGLLATLQEPSSEGIQPLVKTGLERFHSGISMAGSETDARADVVRQNIGGGDDSGLQTADALFNEYDDFELRMERLRNEMHFSLRNDVGSVGHGMLTDSSELGLQVGNQLQSEPEGVDSTDQENVDWRLAPDESLALCTRLQTMSLPLLSARDQALLMVLLQGVAQAPVDLDLDGCGRRYVHAFDIHVALRKYHLRRADAGETIFLQHLSSEDICWALHSDCQGTIVDRILSAFGSDLDWALLRQAGVGLWLTDSAALKRMLELLPRVVLRRQGAEIKPETVALWYALLGRRSLLAALYRQQKQNKIADLLSNNLAEEPWTSKAHKNALELLRQRRFELACAFFVMSRRARDAIDVCVRYLQDWSLALLIAQCHKHGSDGVDNSVATELYRLLRGNLLPTALNVADPWLASLAHWHLGDEVAALRCVTPPYGPVGGLRDDIDLGDSECQFFSGATLRHTGVTPGIAEFRRVLRDSAVKRNLPLDEWLETSIQDAARCDSVMESESYVARCQPLLSLPPAHSFGVAFALPWRTVSDICWSLAALFCSGGKPRAKEDGSLFLADVAEQVRQRLGVPVAIFRKTVLDVCSAFELESCELAWRPLIDGTFYFSPSSVPLSTRNPSKTCDFDVGASSPESRCLPPYLLSDGACAENEIGSSALFAEARLCRVFRVLGASHLQRAIVENESGFRATCLAAIAWRCVPELLKHGGSSDLSISTPVRAMHLALQLACAPCVSMPPPPIFGARLETKEFPSDLSHIVAALAASLATLLSLRALAPAAFDGTDVRSDGTRTDCAEDFSRQLIDPCPLATSVEVVENGPGQEAHVTPISWKPTLWQSLRVMLEQLSGSTADKRNLFRTGALPSLIVSLFLQPPVRADALCDDAEVKKLACVPDVVDESLARLAGDGPVRSNPLMPVRTSAQGPARLTPPRSEASWPPWPWPSPTPSRSPTPSPSPSPRARSLAGSDDEPDPIRCKRVRMKPEYVLATELARDHAEEERVRELVSCVATELTLEHVLGVLRVIQRKKSSSAPSSANHWVTVWYEALLSALRAFLQGRVRDAVLASVTSVLPDTRWPVILCAPERHLNEAFGSIGGEGFKEIWTRLRGTRRLQVLFAHHPCLHFPGKQLGLRNAVLWRSALSGSGISGTPIRCLCADRSGPPRLIVNCSGFTFQMHAGLAVRFAGAGFEAEETSGHLLEVPNRALEAQVGPYVRRVISDDQGQDDSSPCEGHLGNVAEPTPGKIGMNSSGDAIDVAAEFLISGTGSHDHVQRGEEGSSPERGPDVNKFLATLLPVPPRKGNRDTERQQRLPSAPVSAAPSGPSSLIAASGVIGLSAHPFWPIYACALNDCGVQLWAVDETEPRLTLPQVLGENTDGRGSFAWKSESSPSFASHGSATSTQASSWTGRPNEPSVIKSVDFGPSSADQSEQKFCDLSWNASGDRLLGVGSSTGVTMWALGSGACRAVSVPTGSVHSRVNCGAFVSSATLVATAGRRSDPEGCGVSAASTSKTWPHACAGLCIWDTLSRPKSSLVAHDGLSNDSSPSAAPVNYTCIAWDPNQASLFCGTKEGELRIFDVRQRRILRRIQAHAGSHLRHCFMLPSSSRVATLSSTAEVKIWSLNDLECLECLPSLHKQPRGVGVMLGKTHALQCATLLSEDILITGGRDGVVMLTRL